MLDRPDAERLIRQVASCLPRWNAEADRFRQASHHADRGAQAALVLVNAAREMARDIDALADALDLMIDLLPAGHPRLGALFTARIAATSLAESVSTSLHGLELHPGVFVRMRNLPVRSKIPERLVSVP